jgi:hypothetical protein
MGACKKCPCSKAGASCTPACGCRKGHNSLCLNFDEAIKVRKMTTGAIKKTLAQSGLSPVGVKDELVMRLAKYLQEHNAGNSEDKKAAEDAGASKISPKMLIKKVTELADEHAALLSLSGVVITATSSTATMRKAYLKLSRHIHPDKHQGSAEAKGAFQCLVVAFETLSSPQTDDDTDANKGKRRKVERVQRSNDGCYKTRIHCPRCHIRWGAAQLGLEKPSYNFFMQAIKQYVCGRCACQFGAMTADHYCPRCNNKFDYDPEDYHRKILCGNPSCKKAFGFWYFDCSERREREVRIEAKEMQENAARKRAQRQRRANRYTQREPSQAFKKSHAEKLNDNERLFVKGLIEVCPRCGITRAELPQKAAKGEKIGPARAHLIGCNDAAKIKSYQAKLRRLEAERHSKQSKQSAQEDAMMLKTWEMSGRQVGQLWMLNERILRNQCELNGLSTETKTSDPKTELIGRLAKHLRQKKTLLLTSGAHKDALETTDVGYDTAGIGDVDNEDLPSNLHTMETEELKAVCASYGIKYDSKKDGKYSLINKLENARFKGNKEMTLMLTGKKANGDLLLTDTAGASSSKASAAPANDEVDEWGYGDDDLTDIDLSALTKPKKQAPTVIIEKPKGSSKDDPIDDID